MKKQLFIIILSALFLVGSVNVALSQWIAPGMLAKAHKELRNVTSCLKCHFLAGGLDNASCKSCHDELRKKSKKENKGLHSRVKSKCVACHTDHRGADFNITSIDEEIFKHLLTGYELKDSHVLKCKKCHKKEDSYLGNSQECLGCHADVHKKAVPEDCIQCHNYKEWKDYAFDHLKNAEFKLVGKHGEAKCELCHPRNTVKAKSGDEEKEYQVLKFKPIKSETCRDCHYDVHGKQFKGQTCDACHSLEKGWKEYIFDHQSDKFSYKLEGKHKDVECLNCHVKNEVKYTEFKIEKKVLISIFEKIKSEDCTSCHYDIHKGQFKDQKCDTCHSLEKGWKDYLFKHESKQYRGFKLEGKHKDVECEKCHKRSEISYTEFDRQKKVSVGKFKPFETGKCNDCHYDVHKGQFKERKCGECHTADKEWRDTKFDHEAEKELSFKIEGKHKEVKCEQCHERSELQYTEFGILKNTQLGKFKPIESAQCSDCHKDAHKTKYRGIEKVEGVTCNTCHIIEKDWKESVYKHKQDSKYIKYNPEGQIKESSCAECHICESEDFCLTCCFERMGMMPLR